MRLSVPFVLVAAAIALVALSGCGADAQRRPHVVASWPPEGALLDGSVSAVHVTWNEPVTILNPDAIAASADGVGIAVRLIQAEGDPTGTTLLPKAGAYFPLDAEIRVHLVAGAVVNADEHYALDTHVLTFRTGTLAQLWVGRTGSATSLDPDTLVAGADVATPAGQDPRALIRADVGADQRIWVQLAHGNGSGHALAWFGPLDLAMTPIALTTGGGDLTAPTALLAVDADGRRLLAAFRDEALGRVRVVRVDMDTQAESDTLLLSPAADAATAPYGLALDDDRRILLVACEGPDGPVLAQVDLATFAEIDRSPAIAGVHAEPLPISAGPMTYGRGHACVVERDGDEAALVDVDSYSIQHGPHGVTGTHTAQVTDLRRTLRLAGLASYADDEGLVLRTIAAGFLDPAAAVVVDAVAGVPSGSTSVRVLGREPFRDRFLAILDTDIAARFTWDGGTLTQDDLDPLTEEIDAADLSATAPGVLVLGEEHGALPPLAP